MGMMRRGNREDYIHNTTLLGGVETKNGFIPHVSTIYADFLIQAPVKITPVAPKSSGGASGRRYPVIRGGRYVHALPGGGEIMGSSVA